MNQHLLTKMYQNDAGVFRLQDISLCAFYMSQPINLGDQTCPPNYYQSCSVFVRSRVKISARKLNIDGACLLGCFAL